MIKVSVRKRPDRANLQLVYTCPFSGDIKTKSAGTTCEKKAERAAERWQTELNLGDGNTVIPWATFRKKFEDEHAINKSENTQSNYCFGLNKFESLMGKPRDIRLINATVISTYSTKLRQLHDSQSTVATHLMVLRVALKWAASIGLIQRPPHIKAPTIENRGRSITVGEFIGLIRRMRKGCKDPAGVTRLLLVMYLGGLRISEAVKLHANQGPVQVDLAGRRPAIIWHKRGHKAKRDDRTPIAPDFARYLTRFKTGPIVNSTMSLNTIQNRFNMYGQGITAHDLRRTFGSRWALKVHPVVLQKMMRHKTMETTMKFYVDIESDKIADELWSSSVHAHVHETRFNREKSKSKTVKNTGKTD